MNLCVVLLSFLVFYAVFLLFLKSTVPEGASCLHIVLISPETQNIEQLLRWNALCVGYCVLLGGGKLLIADDNMTPYQREIAGLFADKRDIPIIPIDSLAFEELSEQYNQIRIVT